MTSPRALLSLLFNGSKAIDVVRTAFDLGLLEALGGGPVSLGELSSRFGLVPLRLYKLMDCLECIGFVTRTPSSALADTVYQAVPGVLEAAREVLGPGSQELDRDTYPWQHLQGQLPAVLRGEVGMPPSLFEWPLSTPEQIASFEQSMTAGLGPIIESFSLWGHRLWDRPLRLLDVGGGDGTLAAQLVSSTPGLTADVYNLPAVEPLVPSSVGFVGGDFLAEELPRGYDVLSFVRVLHDWPPETTHSLLEKAFAALPPGGRIVICEEFRNSERLAKQFFWSYFLLGVDSCSSLLREASYYVHALGDIGFHSVEVLPGPFEIVVAVR